MKFLVRILDSANLLHSEVECDTSEFHYEWTALGDFVRDLGDTGRIEIGRTVEVERIE